MTKLIFTEKAFEEYLYWQTQDKKTLRRIVEVNRLVYRVSEDNIEIYQCKGHYDD